MRKLLLLTILLIAFFSLAPDARAAVLSKAPNNLGLVGYWGFDEGSGTLAGDSSGSGNNGTITGATWTNGKRGKALDFNGSDQHIEISATSALKPATELTISAWFKADGLDTEWGPVVEGGGNLNNGTGYYFGYYPGGTTFVFYVGDGTYDYVATTLTTGQWYHVVGTYSASGSLYLYVNGVQVHTNTHTVSSISYDSSPISIAKLAYCCSSGHHFDGQIDDVRIYNRAISATDVSNLYKAGQVTRKAISERGLVGYWPLNEGTGTVAGDSSGNGNNGSLSGSPTWVNGKRSKALSFDGTDDYVGIGSSFTDTIESAGSIGAWVNRSSNTGGVFNRSTGSGWVDERLVIYFRNDNNTWGWSLANGSSYQTSAYAISTIPANEWTNLVVTWNGSNVTVYINGVQTDQVSQTVTPEFTGVDTRIGWTQGLGGQFFSGKLDEVRIYNRALSAAEVAALYKQNETTVNANTNSRLTSGLVGLWSFNGNNLNMASTTAEILDMSGNGNHGDNSGGRADAGRTGQGWRFDGDDYIEADHTSSMDVTALTIAMWIRTPTSLCGGVVCFRALLSKQGADRDYNFYTYSSDGTNITHMHMSSARFGVTMPAVTTPYKPGEWYHVAFTVDASGNYVHYTNGASFASGTITAGANANSNYPIWIGRADNYYNDIIDEVRVYNRALSASEIKQLYNMGQ